jgi:initiation factor 1A
MPKKTKARKGGVTVEVSYPSKNDTDQEYGVVTKILGGNWIIAKCSDEFERRCHIRGALQRFKTGSTKIVVNDVILISKRDDKSGDVILKYPSEVARSKIKRGEIVINTKNDTEDHTDDTVEFVEPDEEFDFNTI